MWRLPDDDTKAVITAAEQIHCANRKCSLRLPETAIVFFMSKGTDYLAEHYHGQEMSEPFPRFLNRCPIWEIKELNLCFLNGGCGAPQAADTVETLAVLGCKTIIAVGMCGAYDENVVSARLLLRKKPSLKKGHPFTIMNPLRHHFQMNICLT